MSGNNKTGLKTMDKVAAKPFTQEVYRDGDGIWLDLAPGYCTENDCIGLRGDTVRDLLSQLPEVRVCPCGPDQNHGENWFEAAEAIRAAIADTAQK